MLLRYSGSSKLLHFDVEHIVKFATWFMSKIFSADGLKTTHVALHQHWHSEGNTENGKRFRHVLDLNERGHIEHAGTTDHVSNLNIMTFECLWQEIMYKGKQTYSCYQKTNKQTDTTKAVQKDLLIWVSGSADVGSTRGNMTDVRAPKSTGWWTRPQVTKRCWVNKNVDTHFVHTEGIWHIVIIKGR